MPRTQTGASRRSIRRTVGSANRLSATSSRRRVPLSSLAVPGRVTHLLTAQTARRIGATRGDVVEGQTVEAAADEVRRNRTTRRGHPSTGTQVATVTAARDDQLETILVDQRG